MLFRSKASTKLADQRIGKNSNSSSQSTDNNLSKIDKSNLNLRASAEKVNTLRMHTPEPDSDTTNRTNSKPELTGALNIEKKSKASGLTRIISYLGQKYIGEGNDALVFGLKSDSGKEAVLKVSKGDPASIQRANTILKRLLRNVKKVPGLISKFKGVIELDSPNGESFGAIQKKYDGDLSCAAINKLDLKSKLDMSLQLANGLAFLHENDFHHADIKPENIFFTKNETGHIQADTEANKTGHIQADIGDIDEGQFLNGKDLRDCGAYYVFPLTQGFVVPEDVEHRRDILIKVRKGEDLQPSDKTFLKSIDVYALGATYKSILLKDSQETRNENDMFIFEPFPPNPDRCVGTSTISPEQAASNDIPENVSNFINLMLSPLWEERPTSEQVKAFFETVTILNQNQ